MRGQASRGRSAGRVLGSVRPERPIGCEAVKVAVVARVAVTVRGRSVAGGKSAEARSGERGRFLEVVWEDEAGYMRDLDREWDKHPRLSAAAFQGR